MVNYSVYYFENKIKEKTPRLQLILLSANLKILALLCTRDPYAFLLHPVPHLNPGSRCAALHLCGLMEKMC